MITDFLTAFLGLGSHIYTALGGTNVAQKVGGAFDALYSSEIKAYIQRFFSLFFYFFPKDVFQIVLSVFISIIVIRIILAIVAEIWFG